METPYSQYRNTSPVDKEWDLQRLYSDLEMVNKRSLSNSAKQYLECILLGQSPSDIAAIFNPKSRQSSGTIRTVLSRDVYPCLSLLLKLPESYRMRWNKVPILLSQYKVTKKETFPSPTSYIHYEKSQNNYVGSCQVKSDIINGLLKKYFLKKGFTEDFLSSNTKSMSFRSEWQSIVNKLVSETRETLLAMVLDTELKKWWSSIAGTMYMATNVNLLKNGVKIKRIFILNSLDFRIRNNAIMNAYLHEKMGVEVKILDNIDCKIKMFIDADMISVHDKELIALYYLSEDSEVTELLLDYCSISAFISFYDELFDDDRLCEDVDKIISNSNLSSSFFSDIENQINYLKRISFSTSVKEFLGILPN